MNADQLTQILDTIAMKEIPEMDRLDAIHRRLRAHQAARTRRRTRWVVAVAVILLLISATVAYAVYQIATDPGLESVQKAGLVTELDLSQTADGFTVRLTKGYADANRVALWYVIESDALEDSDSGRIYVDAGLFRADSGEWFGTGGQSGYTDSTVQPPALAGLLTFDHAETTPPDGVVDLRLELRIEQFPDMSSEPPGDGRVPALENTTLATFDFEFSLPVSEALEIKPQQSVTAHDVEMTLESLRIAPSQTRASVCFDMPSAKDWQLAPTLMIDGDAGLIVSAGTQGAKGDFTLNSPRRCMTLDFVAPYNEDSRQLVLEVARLQSSVPEPTPELLDQATKKLAEQGIIVQFNLADHGMGWDVISAPEGLSESEVGMMIWDSMREMYDGPWRFVVDLQ